jgi:ferric-dicitrate binding protein FerR (iron transport regulator)
MNEEHQHIIPYELLTRYLSGDISEDERLVAEKWIAQSPDNTTTFKDLKSVWDSLDKVQDLAMIDLESEWIRQKNMIGFKKIHEDQKGEKSHFWNISKIAAVFLVLFAAAFAIYYFGPDFKISRMVTDEDTKTLELADGTMVTLNASSSIRYPIKFKGNTREVSLTGEAYFEVFHDSDKPFIVNTELTAIKVVGTAFNIRAYEEQSETVVTVTEGKVAFFPKEEPEKQIILDKNKIGTYNRKNGNIQSDPATDVNFLAWKTGRIVFENSTLNNVRNTLNDVYRANISLQNSTLDNCRITATFDQQSLDSVLKVIASTLDLDITRKGDVITLSGEGCQ